MFQFFLVHTYIQLKIKLLNNGQGFSIEFWMKLSTYVNLLLIYPYNFHSHHSEKYKLSNSITLTS